MHIVYINSYFNSFLKPTIFHKMENDNYLLMANTNKALLISNCCELNTTILLIVITKLSPLLC